MAFTLEKFDIIKQNHDKTCICFYRETDTAMATLIASGYFDDMANFLGSNSLIIIEASDGTGVYQVTNTANVITVSKVMTSAVATTTTVAADVLAIPITHDVVVKTTGADAEALTLADGSVTGQKLTIILGVAGGGLGTLTPTNFALTSITFEAVGDSAELVFDGTDWQVVSITSRRATVVTVAADVLAIPVTHDIVIKTTGADAEALTLADGVTGQKLIIILGTDGGGDGTLTPVSFANGATLAFADVNDSVELVFDGTSWFMTGVGYGAPVVA